jgi:hypothetical protein
MSFNIYKIILNYRKYKHVLSFSKDNSRNLYVDSFFGLIPLSIPINVIFELDKKYIKLYFNSTKFIFIRQVLKSFCHILSFSTVSSLFTFFISTFIKGIGYKFVFNNDKLIIHSGNSLPSLFETQEDLQMLSNFNSYRFIMGSSNFTFLNHFGNKLRSICKPNKYKEMGIFLEKKQQ